MSTAFADIVPDPARAPGPRPRVRSRTARAVLAGVLLTVTIALVWSCAAPMSATGFGPAATQHVMLPWWEEIPWLRRRVALRHTVQEPKDAIWLAADQRTTEPCGRWAGSPGSQPAAGVVTNPAT